MPRSLSAYEEGIIIAFNKAYDTAHICAYEKKWQKQLKGKLVLKLVMDGGFGTLQCCLYNGCFQPYN